MKNFLIFSTIIFFIICFNFNFQHILNGEDNSESKQTMKWIKTGGPRGGMGYDIRIHPWDKKIMYVTDNPSGAYKSYDGGNTWVAKNEGMIEKGKGPRDSLPIFCCTVDPNNPDIIWTGTLNMRGIFKSIDGGETWKRKDNGIEEVDNITFRGFGVRPGNSNIVFTGAEIITVVQGVTKGKIYKTEDGGENWKCVWQGDNLVRFVLFDYQNPDIMYASTGIHDREAYNGIGVGILKSTDGGKTWRQINNGIDANNLFIGFLEMHPRNPRILFASFGNTKLAFDKDILGAIYRTTNGGETWKKVLECTLRRFEFFGAVAISPSHPNIIYAASNRRFYISEDGGENWRKSSQFGPPGMDPGTPISMVVDPYNPKIVFINSYGGGNFKTTDGGNTWIDSSKGYTGADVRSITIWADKPDFIYAASRSSIARSFNGGMDWQDISFPAEGMTLHIAECIAIVMNPRNTQELIVSNEPYEQKLYKTSNGGNSWKVVFDEIEKNHSFMSLAYAPSDPSIIYAGAKKNGLGPGSIDIQPSYGIYKSTDGGESWRQMNTGLEYSTKNIICIAVHPKDANIVYAGTAHDGIFKTTDGGNSWISKSNGIVSAEVRSLAIDPQNPEITYAGLGGGAGIFKSTNGGESWHPINAGVHIECPSYLLPIGGVKQGISFEKPPRILLYADYYSTPWTSIRSIVIDPTNSNFIYAGDYFSGFYISYDGGNNWYQFTEGLSTRLITSMAISSDGSILYVATEGEGVFRLRFILAPLNFNGMKVENRSLSQVEYINVLTWQVNPKNGSIAKYRIYKVEGNIKNLLTELDSNTFKYLHRKVEKDKSYTYAIVAVNEESKEGKPAYLKVQ